jgi:glycosyltransferase involved in cell wall biosynthesis
MDVIVASPAYPQPPIDGDKTRWSALLPELAGLTSLAGVFGFMSRMEARDTEFDGLFQSIDVVETPAAEVRLRALMLELRRHPSAFGRRATPRWRRAVAAAVARRPTAPLLLLGTSGGYIPPVAAHSVLDLLDVRSRVRTLSGDRITRRSILTEELALARRHRILLASEADRRWLIDHGADAERIHLVPHGVDRRFLAATPRDHSQTILFVGNLRYEPNRQGLEWFMHEAWPALKTSGARLRIVGYGAERVRSEEAVEVYPNVADVLPHYEAAAMLIAPLLEARGTQFKVLEAMAAGLPVVCTSPAARGLADSHPAQVSDDLADLAAMCVSLLADPSRRQGLSQRGRAYVRDHHDWASSAALTRDALQSAAA